MKKSQVLAALAFAFALGVAMPAMQTASVFAVESVFSDAATTADKCQVDQVLANIRAYGDYAKYAAIYKAEAEAEKYTATKYSPTNLTNGLETAINDVITENSRRAGVTPDTYSAPSTADYYYKIDVLRDVRNKAIATVSSTDYDNFRALYTLMKDARATEGQLTDAIYKIDHVFTNSPKWSASDIKKYVSGTLTGYTWDDTALYDEYVVLIQKADEATEVLDAYEGLKTAIENFKSWPQDQTLVKSNDATVVDVAASKTNPIAELLKLVGNPTASDSEIEGYPEDWKALVAEVIKQSDANTTEIKPQSWGYRRENLDIVKKLAELFYKATKSSNHDNLGTQLSSLPNAGGACGVSDGSNNNGGTGDDQNKPTEGDNKAPNTGALANAEGSASTTVAMVAGIATALTAAGAGVVAYRNARRSTRK